MKEPPTPQENGRAAFLESLLNKDYPQSHDNQLPFKHSGFSQTNTENKRYSEYHLPISSLIKELV